jgi:hypothetical protein
MAKGNTSKATALGQSEDAVIAKEKASARGKKVEKELLFSKTNYIIIGVGLMMVIIGFFLMSGGHNEPDEWHPDVIYSFVRITISPIVILSGLGVVIFAIFKSSDDEVQNIGA